MVTVTVEYLLKFREITGKEKEKIMIDDDKPTVEKILKHLKSKYGAEFEQEFTNPSGDEIAGKPLILLNGLTLRISEDLTRFLSDGDIITMTYAVFGG